MELKLQDGQVVQVEEGVNALDIAKNNLPDLYKTVLAADLNGSWIDAFAPIHTGGELKMLTWEDEGGRWTLRHTASHIMAQAVLHLFPGTKLAIGPAIENGFYYDFDTDRPFSTDDFAAIEKEMKKIVKENYRVERFELPRDKAIAMMKDRDEPYKVELIQDLPEGEVISFYRQGDFTDLCAGPHLGSTGKVKHFKLTSVAGAYWRGDEKNKMLQRIYATAFPTKEELESYLERIEEAKKRDHRKLGRQLDLYDIQEDGPGFPFFYPNGMILRNQLEDFWRQQHSLRNYHEIKTPIILNRDLWIRSGHWDHYQNNMYFTTIDDAQYAIKPMNCPGAMLTYKRKIYSYRDLPERLCELGLVHRHELSGALHGLMRVRCFTQDDSHIFMMREQIKDEVFALMEKFEYFYDLFGFKYSIELSTRPEDSMGSDEDWEVATESLRQAIDERNVPYTINEGDGAFYGPKIDFHLEDALGRSWQCGTIQLDFQMPERFELEYVGADGAKHRPVILHSVVYGSIERFIAILTEHTAGAFPLWLSPVQVRVLAMTDRNHEAASKIEAQLLEKGIRAESDLRSEKIGYKIREAQVQKVPYMLILGDKDEAAGVVSVRTRKGGDIGAMPLEDFMERVSREIQDKTRD